MRYKVGEVANLMGLTTAAIHFYEKEGIIKTKKTENGHRYYELEDIVKLIQCKESRRREVPLKEITNAFQNSDYNKRMFIGNQLKNKVFLQEKIDLYKQLVEDLDCYIEQLCKMDSLIGNYELVSSEEMLFNGDPNGHFIGSNSLNNEIMKEWVAQLPFTKLSVLFDINGVSSKEPKAPLGLLISKRQAKSLGLPLSEDVISFEKGIYIHTVIECRSIFDKPDYKLDPIIDYMQKRKLSAKQKAFGNILFHDNDKESTRSYIDLWIPVEQK